MKLLIFNTGSSSIKFKIFENLNEIAEGKLKNHQEGEYKFEYRIGDSQNEIEIKEKDYSYPIDYIKEFFESKGESKFLNNLDGIGHRIVHGGEEFTENSVVLDKETIERIEKYNDFAPLHNPPALKVVEQVTEDFPGITQYGVFDTTFHLTNKKEQYLYGLPYGYYENLKIRRFGFHGTSYQFIYEKLLEEDPNVSEKNIVVAHLGSGSSVCAIKQGKSFEHSFGFTPNENLVMSTRAGEVDYDAVNFLRHKMGLTDDEVDEVLNKKSGLLGISGYSKDMKTLVDDYDHNERAKLAVNMYVNSVAEWIARLFIHLENVNLVVFTGGIGFGSWPVREMVTQKLKIFGIKLDSELNKNGNGNHAMKISSTDSTIDVAVMQTDEETQIAKNINAMQK